MMLRLWILIISLLFSGSAYAVTNLHTIAGTYHEESPEQVLVKILEDEKLRTQLVDKLKSTAGYESIASEEGASAHRPVSYLVGEMNQAVSQLLFFVSNKATASYHSLAILVDHVFGEWRQFFSAHSWLQLCFGIGSVAFVLILALAIRWGMGKIAQGTLWYISTQRIKGDWKPYQALVARSFIDIINTLLAWFVSYIFVMLVIHKGWLSEVMHQFLMTYLMFSIGLVVFRIILSPFYQPLRFINLDNASALGFYYFLRSVLLYLVFFVLFLSGIMAISGADQAMIESFQELMISLLIVVLLGLVWHYRKAISLIIKPSHQEDDLQKLSGMHLLRLKLAYVWHWVASAYLLIMLWAWLFDFEQTFTHQLQSSFLTVALLLGFFSMRWFIAQTEEVLVAFFRHQRHDLPFFSKRATSIVSIIRLILQIAVVAATWLLFLSIWGLLDLNQFYEGSFWHKFVQPMLNSLVTVFFALGVWLGLLTLIEYKLIDSQKRHPRYAKDNDTLLHLLRNVVTIATVLITSIIVLADLGVHVGPLIAGAGILSLAIGFGAQTLVKDVINGLFNIIEGTLKVGSWVRINGHDGWVERVTLRTVSLRNNQTGILSIVPFSSVSMVENYTKDYAYYYGSIEVSYDEDYDHVAAVLDKVGAALEAQEDIKANILSSLEVRGLSAFESSGYKVSCRIKTMPGQQRVVGRVFNRLVKQHFDAEGISFPFPTRTVHLVKNSNDKTNPQS